MRARRPRSHTRLQPQFLWLYCRDTFALEFISGPDLILMDSTLPRLDGLGATRRIRDSSNGRNTPIVFISGRTEPKYRAGALDTGCDGLLVKPVNFDLFRGALEKHLGPS